MEYKSGEQPKLGKVPTLRDLTLETIVLNFGKVFSKEKHSIPFKIGRETVKGIYLPLHMFDDILEKSKEMSWRILPKELLPCVENMDKLQWKDLSYFTDRVFLRPKDVSFICRKRPTMKSLSIRIVYSDAREISDCLSEVVGSLESLDLRLTRYDENATDIRPQDVSSLPLLRLKELTFNQGLGKLPFRVDSEALEYLQVPLSKSTKEMIEIFKNIKHLSINRVSGEDHSGLTYVMRAAWKLPELRYSAKPKISPKKKLKVLAIDENYSNDSHLFAEKVVRNDKLEGVLSIPEKIMKLDVETFIWKIKFISERVYLGHLSPNDKRKIEELLDKCMDEELTWTTLTEIKQILDNLDVSTSFKIKLISRMCSLAPIANQYRCVKIPLCNYRLDDFLLDFLEKNPNNALAKKISKSFELYPETFDGKMQVILISEITTLPEWEFE